MGGQRQHLQVMTHVRAMSAREPDSNVFNGIDKCQLYGRPINNLCRCLQTEGRPLLIELERRFCASGFCGRGWSLCPEILVEQNLMCFHT